MNPMRKLIINRRLFQLKAFLRKIFDITGKSCRIAGYINESLRSHRAYGIQKLFVAALSRRINNHYICAVSVMILFIKLRDNLFRLTCEKLCISQSVKCRVFLGILYSLRHDLNSENFLRLLRQE